MSSWLKQGKIKFLEDITDGLENAPEAFIGLLKGKDFGKTIVRVSQHSCDLNTKNHFLKSLH